MNDKGDFLAGLLIGALAGALAGVLLAPAEGSATRQNIGDVVGRAGDRVKASANATRAALGNNPAALTATAKRQIGNTVERLRGQLQSLLATLDQSTSVQEQTDAAASTDGEIPAGGEA